MATCNIYTVAEFTPCPGGYEVKLWHVAGMSYQEAITRFQDEIKRKAGLSSSDVSMYPRVEAYITTDSCISPLEDPGICPVHIILGPVMSSIERAEWISNSLSDRFHDGSWVPAGWVRI